MTVTIVTATRHDHVLAARRLFEEYAATLTFAPSFQNFRHELDTLPGECAPPNS